jgi:hypothetical protein
MLVIFINYLYFNGEMKEYYIKDHTVVLIQTLDKQPSNTNLISFH